MIDHYYRQWLPRKKERREENRGERKGECESTPEIMGVSHLATAQIESVVRVTLN
jgi:hypothetical protein